VQQQINLFQPIFCKERKLLSFAVFLQFLAIVLLALIGLYLYNFWQVRATQSQITQLKQQHNQRLGQLEQISREAASRDPKGSPEYRIQALQAELDAEKYVLSVLSSAPQSQTHGFSPLIQGMANQVVHGLWLKKFNISEGGKDLTIVGASVSPELLPKFLQGLSKEPQMMGKQFRVMHLVRDAPDRPWLDFILSSDIKTKTGESP